MDNNKNVVDLVDIVVRQTDYNNDMALEKLNEYNFDPVEVIRNYMNPTKKVFYKTTQPETTNQRVYKEIRTMLDSANATYRKKEEEKENAN